MDLYAMSRNLDKKHGIQAPFDQAVRGSLLQALLLTPCAPKMFRRTISRLEHMRRDVDFYPTPGDTDCWLSPRGVGLTVGFYVGRLALNNEHFHSLWEALRESIGFHLDLQDFLPQAESTVEAAAPQEELPDGAKRAFRDEGEFRYWTLPAKDVGVLEIRQRLSDDYWDATAMCRVAEKRFNDWATSEPAKRYLEHVSCTTGIPVVQLVASKALRPDLGGGTWVHEKVAMHLAHWVSDELADRFGTWAKEKLETLVYMPTEAPEPEITHFSIKGWAHRLGKSISQERSRELGIEAGRLARQLGLEIKKFDDARWGTVNAYPREVLEQLTF